MVIIKENTVPAMQWPLGRIVNTNKGDDGLIRMVDVKTAPGALKMAVHPSRPRH